jgi:N-acylglucosamine-6-phosphate 2-epimerase
VIDRWSFRGSLVVSCQAPADSPLASPDIIAAMARAAVMGGARAVRLNGDDDVRAVRSAVSVPIIGLLKRRVDGSPVYITPTVEDAVDIANAGADLVAVDATLRVRPGGMTGPGLVARLRTLGIAVVADVDAADAGLEAARAGAEFVASTLAGYTSGSTPSEPDLDLVHELASGGVARVIAEGRYHQPAQVRAALDAGAFAVVVGQAITNPVAITRRFVDATDLAEADARASSQ